MSVPSDDLSVVPPKEEGPKSRPMPNYGLIRGLELEGRHPHDAGGWLPTIRRIEFGEGMPPYGTPESYVEHPPGTPLPPSPKLNLRQYYHFRPFFYRRIRSAIDAITYLNKYRDYYVGSPTDEEIGLSISFQLYPDWIDPPNGVLPSPTADQKPLPESHCVFVHRFWDEYGRFVFRNTWGPTWGKNGLGLLPVEYFDTFNIESWCSYFKLRTLFQKLYAITTGLAFNRSVYSLEDDQRVHSFVLQDEQHEERYGWAFIHETDNGLEVEELYVQPKYRQQGYGTRLLSTARQFSVVENDNGGYIGEPQPRQ